MRRQTSDHAHADLVREIRRALLAMRGSDSMWGYRPSQAACVEPTALACLALLASTEPESQAADHKLGHDAALWIGSIARADGSLPVSQKLDGPGWTTPYGMLLSSQFSDCAAYPRRAALWLLRLEGNTLPGFKNTDSIIGHDWSIVGWPWVERTHSWLEPTALAILALCRQGFAENPRVQAGVSLLEDRALPGGGWNGGGKAVFGHDLRPQPAPTGLALLALAARSDRTEAVGRAVAYLTDALPSLRSALFPGLGPSGLACARRFSAPRRTLGGRFSQSLYRPRRVGGGIGGSSPRCVRACAPPSRRRAGTSAAARAEPRRSPVEAGRASGR